MNKETAKQIRELPKDLIVEMVALIHQCWISFQFGADQPFNAVSTLKQVMANGNGIRHFLDNPEMTAEQIHEDWRRFKEKDGWQYGPIRDEQKKEHPCMVPYNELPEQERKKDELMSMSWERILPIVLTIFQKGHEAGRKEMRECDLDDVESLKEYLKKKPIIISDLKNQFEFDDQAIKEAFVASIALVKVLLRGQPLERAGMGIEDNEA